ncbi:MAG: polysaccharide deacetylase family protein [bacterium]
MKIRYLIANSILGNLLLNLAKRRNNKDKGVLKILIYHDIPYKDFDKFEAQIKWIRSRYEFARSDDLENILAGQIEYTGTKVLLTFDDGFKSNALLAEKVLNPLGIQAVFFIPPGFINAKNRDEQRTFIAKNIYKPCLKPEEIPDDMAPMDWQDLECLLDHRHTIGSHTINHRRLSALESDEELRCEIIEGGDILQKKLGVDIEHFSFPFGDIDSIDSRAMKIIRERYKYCYSGIRGNNSINTNPYAILRDPVSVDDPPAYFRFILENGLGFLYRKRALLLDVSSIRKKLSRADLAYRH